MKDRTGLPVAISQSGYDINQAIHVLRMPNGKLVIGGGYHRVEAMRRLSEVTIPAKVDWISLSGKAGRRSAIMASELAKRLKSTNEDEVFNALYELGSAKPDVLPRDALMVAIRLFAASDVDIRLQAISAVSIHWGFCESFERLLDVLAGEKNTDVMLTGVRGLGRIATDCAEHRSRALRALIGIVESDCDWEVRWWAYQCARKVTGVLPLFEYAGFRLNQDFELDYAWVRRVLDSLVE